MAAAKDEIVCHVCGFANKPDVPRCVSCGAKLEALGAALSAEDEARRQEQQTGFSVKWVAVAFAIYGALQTLFLPGLDLALDSYDPQGVWGLMISMPIWLVGGLIVGRLSPGRTFLEPAVGAMIACIPTIAYVFWITPEGFEPGLVEAITLGAMGVMISLFGAVVGEKLQGSISKPSA